METFGSGAYVSPLGEFSRGILAMTADLTIVMALEPVGMPFATSQE